MGFFQYNLRFGIEIARIQLEIFCFLNLGPQFVQVWILS
ncbi:hypothetical protein MnTg03_01522 [bacterium MnTg03]|nr:hypothetical protein MnTg03_01522 [bacterium MnTg03]